MLRHLRILLAGLAFVALAGPANAAFPGTAAGPHQQAESAPGGPVLSEQLQYLGTTQFSCTDFNASGTGAAILDRDNTGTGAETVNLHVTDGTGRALYDLTFTNGLGSYSGGLIGTTAYTAAPLTNPITLTATSLAGNGLPAEVDYVAQGVCSGLPVWPVIPTLSGGGLAALALLLAVGGFVAIRRARRTA